MKHFFLKITAAVLILVLAVFGLWRYEKMAPLTDFAAGLVASIKDLQSNMTGGGGVVTPPPPPSGGGAVLPPADTGGNYGDYDPTAPIDEQLRTAIYDGFYNMNDTIDLSAIVPTREALSAAVADVIYSSPELFYVASGYAIQTKGEDVMGIKPSYTYGATEVTTMRVTYESMLGEIVSGAPTGSDFDKLLYLHDYFVLNYSYDKTLTIRDAYTFFAQKTGVCQAYMLALIAAAERLGIETIPVTSDEMKHAWNMVKLDGEWYHVDLTWDDGGSLPNSISYRYFLQSNNGIVAIDADREVAHQHRSWAAAEVASGTRFDAAAWHYSRAPIAKAGSTYYCTVNTTEKHVLGYIYAGTDPASMSEFTSIEGDGWDAGGGSRYVDCYSGLMVVGNYLYFNSGNAVHRIDVSGSSKVADVFPVSGLSGRQCIYGFYGVESGQLVCCIATAPDDTSSTKARLTF